MRGMSGPLATGVFTKIFSCLVLAFAMAACSADDDRQPDPHLMDLAAQAASSIPMPAAEKIKVSEASKNSYAFQIIYPYDAPYAVSSMANDATNLIRTLLRKLVEDGQKPHDQETAISVWALEIKPGRTGESGHQFDPSERYLIWASYHALSDSIEYEECTEDSSQWLSGHCTAAN
jgi:hypothetical protein